MFPKRCRRAVVTALIGFHPGSRLATGAYPRMAAAFAEGPGPIDLDAVFDLALRKILDAFDPSRAKSS